MHRKDLIRQGCLNYGNFLAPQSHSFHRFRLPYRICNFQDPRVYRLLPVIELKRAQAKSLLQFVLFSQAIDHNIEIGQRGKRTFKVVNVPFGCLCAIIFFQTESFCDQVKPKHARDMNGDSDTDTPMLSLSVPTDFA